jgi:hypothetical protein
MNATARAWSARTRKGSPSSVRQDAERKPRVPIRPIERIATTDDLLSSSDDRQEQVGVVVGPCPLHDRGDSLQACPGVDGRSRERRIASGRSLELHEHEVPYLHERVGLAERVERLGREVRGRPGRPEVVVNLRAGSARAGLTHLPEVVLVAEPQNSLRRNVRELRPQGSGFLIRVVDGCPQPAGLQAELRGHELPGETDRVTLEVVAEREVAQHLEERVMPRRTSHFLQVVVLAADPKTLLRGGGSRGRALRLADEHSLELHHPRVGE